MTQQEPETLSPAEADALDAILVGLSPGVDAEAPAWVARLGTARLLVAVIEWPGAGELDLAPLQTPRTTLHPLDDAAWLLAAPPSDLEARHWIKGLRARLAEEPDLRAAVAEGEGDLGRERPLGPALDRAIRLFDAARSANRHGLFVDAATHARLGEPAAPFGEAFRLAGGLRARPARRNLRGLWVGLAAAAAVILGLTLRPGSPQPDGAIWYTAHPARVERSDGALRAGDHLQLRVEGPAEHYLTLLLHDSQGAWLAPDPALVNHRLTADQTRIEPRFTLDDRPGRERFVAIISAAPLRDPPDLVAALPRPAPADPEDHAALRAAITPFAAGAFRVISTHDILHGE